MRLFPTPGIRIPSPRPTHAALDRLIDQELLREQVRPAQPAPAEHRSARCGSSEAPSRLRDRGGLARDLERYGLDRTVLEKRLSDQIQLMKLVEDRLRPSIQIDQQAVENYYHEPVLPEMKRAGKRRRRR